MYMCSIFFKYPDCEIFDAIFILYKIGHLIGDYCHLKAILTYLLFEVLLNVG